MVGECENESASISRPFRGEVFVASGFSSHKCHCVSQQRQRADHTQRSPVCAGTLDSFWGEGNLCEIVYLVHVCCLEIKKGKTITRKGQTTSRMYLMYLTHQSIHFLLGVLQHVLSLGERRQLEWTLKAQLHVTFYRIALLGQKEDETLVWNLTGTGKKKHFWRKSVRIQAEVQGSPSNDCTQRGQRPREQAQTSPSHVSGAFARSNTSWLIILTFELSS